MANVTTTFPHCKCFGFWWTNWWLQVHLLTILVFGELRLPGLWFHNHEKVGTHVRVQASVQIMCVGMKCTHVWCLETAAWCMHSKICWVANPQSISYVMAKHFCKKHACPSIVTFFLTHAQPQRDSYHYCVLQPKLKNTNFASAWK